MFTYKTIYNIIHDFRSSSGRNNQSAFHYTDTPGRYYFKLFFYFDQGGLLDSRYNEKYSHEKHTTEYYNSALNYLRLNGEYERADLLTKFIQLLQNINTHSPWYFSEIDGVVESLGRKQFADGDMKIEETRPMMTIKCLPDPVDDRIGTLVDLYKAVCFSYVQKKEIIPANLRKFNMGIYVFQTPKRMHDYNDIFASIGGDGDFVANSKYFEFVNCEFFVPSAATAFASFNNKEGVEHNYEIGITYDDVYDERYNAFVLRTIGDFIKTDYTYKQNKEVIESVAQGTDNDPVQIHKTNKMNQLIANEKSKSENIPEKTNLSTSSIFSETKFGQKVTSSIKEGKKQIDRLIDKYSPESLVGAANDYIIDKVDSVTMQTVSNITRGNIFYDDLNFGASVGQTLKNGNIFGAAESIIEGVGTSNNSKKSETTTDSGWKKSIFYDN